MQPESVVPGETFTADLVVVGSGAAGLSAAVRARALGLDVLVIEKSDLVGGTSSLSGGAIWIPDNPLMKEAGASDSAAAALQYLDACVGEPSPASSRARKEAYVREGPRMIGFLRERGLGFVYSDGYPDYYPELPGGHVRGRSLMAQVFDRRQLDDWDNHMRRVSGLKMQVLFTHLREMLDVPYAVTTRAGRRATATALARTLAGKARRERNVSLGQALIGQLLHEALNSGVRILRRMPLRRLLDEDGTVTGVLAGSGSTDVVIRARHGVLLAAGGFARNEVMRKEHLPQPSFPQLTMVNPDDTGDAIRAGVELGGATALMDEATWTPMSVLPDGSPAAPLWERAAPFSIMVNARGERFCNEASSYMDVVHAMYAQDSVPSWLVFDSRHRWRYPFGDALPGWTPRSWLTSGYMNRSDTIAGLAHMCGIDPDGLQRTVARFNRMADAGVDEDFGRGASAFDRVEGDSSHGPNPSLGALRKPPFYAVAHYPGDVSTCGGLLTDQHARVVRTDGTVIDGLYAAGTTSASVMGRVYPGPGCSLGPALVFGFIAANHVAQRCRDRGGAPAA